MKKRQSLLVKLICSCQKLLRKSSLELMQVLKEDIHAAPAHTASCAENTPEENIQGDC